MMKRERNANKRKMLASLLTGIMIVQQTTILSAFASITAAPGSTIGAGISQNGNVYDLTPGTTHGGNGFSHYGNFVLDNSQTANLDFGSIGPNGAFYNLVDRGVFINGILNSVKNGNFYNGSAVFISPEGFAVGASGVINIGSLAAYSPDVRDYNTMKNSPSDITNVNQYYSNSGAINVDGKILAVGDVTLAGRAVNVGADGAVISGIAADQMATTRAASELLFNSIVGGTYTNATDLQASGSTITIKTAEPYGLYIVDEVGTNIMGKVYNVAPEGTLTIQNNAGDLNISGKIKNNGITTIFNSPGKTKLEISQWNGETNQEEIIASDESLGRTGTKLNIADGATIDTTGELSIINFGDEGAYVGGTINHDGNIRIRNGGPEGSAVAQRNADMKELNINGQITNTQVNISIDNFAGGGLKVSGGQINNLNGDLSILNTGAGGLTTLEDSNIKNVGNVTVDNKAGVMNLGGSFTNKGDASFTNHETATDFTIGGYLENKDGLADFVNNGTGDMTFNGEVNNKGATTVTNSANSGVLLFAGDFKNNGLLMHAGDATNYGGTTIDNYGTKLEVSKKITDTSNFGNLKINNYNEDGGIFIYDSAVIASENKTYLSNNGALGINIEGDINSTGDVNITNTGAKGIKIASTSEVAGSSVLINNTVEDAVEGSIDVQGKITANKSVKIKSQNGNLTIGHQDVDNNITSKGSGQYDSINIEITNGSVLNNGVEKVLLNANNNLVIRTIEGGIGTKTQRSGVGTKASGARDFTKSINAKVNGTVCLDAYGQNNQVAPIYDINFATIGSDMNIYRVNAQGRVILTADDDFGETNTPIGQHKYSILNAGDSTTQKYIIQGQGISLIADKNIGTKDNMITFVRDFASGDNEISALANNDIYIREGVDTMDRYNRPTQITVSTMIAREGNLYAEFAGITPIQNITAEGDLEVVTRGKTLEITNLGHLDKSLENGDYFGPHHDGYEFDGRNDGQYKSDILPNKVTLKALDINEATRPTTDATLEGGYRAYADSTVRVKNAVVDKGSMEIVADNIYANGIYAGFNKNGFSKKVDTSTNKITGVYNPDSFDIAVGRPVRPEDVTDIGRTVTERNYYIDIAGDGDITIGDKTTTVDPNNNIVEKTPLEIGGKPNDNPITPPTPTPTPTPTPGPDPTPTPGPDPTPTPGPDPTPGPSGDSDVQTDRQDGKVTWKKVDDTDVEAVDKRQYMRFGVATNEHPVMLEKTDNGIDELIDVSRGGIAVTHSNKLKVGDVVPIHLTYADLDIKADVKVVTASTTRAGASFVNLDKATANKLLYLNILLESSKSLSYK